MKNTTTSGQQFAVLYPVGNNKVLAYHLCYSVTPGNTERPAPWTRITTITAVRSKLAAERITRTEDPVVWADVRQALIEGKTIVYQGRAVA